MALGVVGVVRDAAVLCYGPESSVGIVVYGYCVARRECCSGQEIPVVFEAGRIPVGQNAADEAAPVIIREIKRRSIREGYVLQAPGMIVGIAGREAQSIGAGNELARVIVTVARAGAVGLPHPDEMPVLETHLSRVAVAVGHGTGAR